MALHRRSFTLATEEPRHFPAPRQAFPVPGAIFPVIPQQGIRLYPVDTQQEILPHPPPDRRNKKKFPVIFPVKRPEQGISRVAAYPHEYPESRCHSGGFTRSREGAKGDCAGKDWSGIGPNGTAAGDGRVPAGLSPSRLRGFA